jgi:Leucine-rich repeat (LRR) protein
MSVTDISNFCPITELIMIVNFALLSSFRHASL